MEFTSSFNQTNFMGYCPPSQYDSSHYSNDGWEYHQEDTNSEHFNQWRLAPESQIDQAEHMRYCPEPQNDLYHYPDGVWTYQEECEQSVKMGHLPETQYDPDFDESNNYSYCGWKSQNQRNLSNPYCDEFNNSSNCDSEDLLQKSREFFEKQEQAWKRKEILRQRTNEHLENIRKHLEPSNSKNQFVREEVEKQEQKVLVSSEIAMKDEEHETRILYSQKPLEVTKKHEHSQPSQTSLESAIEKYEEEMKKSWEEQQTSSIKELLSQMLSAKKGVEEQESEEVVPEKSHSIEVEKCKEEKLMEPPMQEALNEEITPIITQQPSLESKEVKATSKNTNSVPNPASKINQAICKRKLAEERPRQGTLAESFPPLRSFLLTNWKKRKKVKNNMSS
ncbi:hypothetical protein AHAS_Ahas04G0124800 [Arachis hypogaea]